MWGTQPEKMTWAKKGPTLAFLWNAEGGRFLDLYAYDAAAGKLRRLTDLESLRDTLTRTAAEKDDRQKAYVPPHEGIAEFDISRDGCRVAFSFRGDLWLVDTAASAPPLRLTRTRAAESAPQFSPGGSKLAFTRDGHLFTHDLRSGQLWQVTEFEGEGMLLGPARWSPDGAHFLYVLRSGSPRRLLLPNFTGRLVTAAPFPRSLAGDMPLDARIFVAPAEGGPARELEPGPWGAKVYITEAPEWSPDSSRILVRVVHPDMKRTQALVFNPAGGKPAVAVEDRDDAWVEPLWAAWSPDSREIVFVSERDGWAHLYVVAREGGTPRQITRGEWEIRTDRIFARDPQWAGGHIYFSSTENGPSERHFYRIRPDSTGKEKLSAREGLHVGTVSEDGAHTALLTADLDNPFDLWVNGRRVTTSPRPEFRQYPWPATRFVSFPSRGDRRPVAAKLLLPPGYPEARKQWPAVFFIHGSGFATSVLKQWGSYHELRYVFNCHLANKGYLVLDMDYRGSVGYGRDWRTGVYLHMGGRDLDDVLGGADYLRSLGHVDMNRIGLWGSSYGGFMAAMAMFLSPDTFKAGAAFSSVTDWENYNAFYTQQRLGRPQDYPEAYRRSSPITFARMLRNPLLLVHGMVDNNVLFQDTVQLAEKLIHEGKTFEQAYYPEESHLFVREETLIDAFRRAAEFFDRHLQ